jgi:hypothetical protein
MTTRIHTIGPAAAFALTSVGATVSASSQNARARIDDRQVEQLLARTNKNADQFYQSLDRASRPQPD